MSEIITLSCPSCDNKLIINNSGITRFVCNTCGREYQIRREGGITYLEDTNIKQAKDTNQKDDYQEFATVDPLEDEKNTLGLIGDFDAGQALSKKHSFDFEKIRQELAEKKAVEQIEAKITRLQITDTNILKKFNKYNVGLAVLGMVYMAVVYALLPMFDSYKELFATMGFFYAPMFVVYLGYYITNRKTTISNQNFIDDKIEDLQKERNDIINHTR